MKEEWTIRGAKMLLSAGSTSYKFRVYTQSYESKQESTKIAACKENDPVAIIKSEDKVNPCTILSAH